MPAIQTANSGRWPSTQWPDLVALRAAGQDPERRQRLHNKILTAYNRPVFEYLLALGFPPETAEDARQRFFINVLGHRRLLERADKKRGRLRDFIRRALRQFASNLRREAAALKRGGGIPHHGLDALSTTPAAALSPDEQFDRDWALGIIQRTEAKLAAEYSEREKSALWETLRPNIEQWTGPATQEETARVLRITRTALSTELTRLRQRYRHVLFLIIAETAADPREAEEDLRHLRRLLSR